VSGADRDEEERDRHASESRAKELRPLRILIVEDEFFISLSTEAMLEMLGHMVVGTAVSADEAEQMAKQEQPDVVLMDIRLIGSRDGIDAAAAIHDNLGIRSIFVTANTDPHTRQRALAANPLGFIEKPLSDRRLRDALSEVD
jgi:DNA-binding NarL/FixJ family response regulator